mmetsp:Transcript_26126/g.46467  ORF Transcript_26126/g.46467 Transcript_26126/m.46467 type:complete len:334 (-) Transcript_26126:2182-3183(-)
MASYRVTLKSKGTSEVNVARILQAVDFSSTNEVFMEEVRPETVTVVHEGPIKSEGKVSSRRNKDAMQRPPEYMMKVTNQRLKSFKWAGVSEETGRYAVLVKDRDELKMILCDHWYKFTRCQELIQPAPAKEVSVLSKKQKEKIREELVSRQLLGDDSEGEDAEKRPTKKPKRRESDEEAEEGREGMDFDREFTDDEESKLSSDESDIVQVPKATRLSESGKEISRAIMSDSDSIDSLDFESSEDETLLLKLSKDAVVKELMRLGKVTMTEFVSECKSKFKQDDRRWLDELKQILSEVADLHKEGSENYLLLKESFKRSIPNHGKRVFYQKLQK